jgi:hypothetical protein
MPRYFFNVRDGSDLPDTEGSELPDLRAAQIEAIRTSGEMLHGIKGGADFWSGDDERHGRRRTARFHAPVLGNGARQASPALMRFLPKAELFANVPPSATPPPVMVDWNRPLTRVLTLKSGEQLRTLHDAAELFTHRFGSVTKSAPLEHAIGLLLRAAETGTRADRKAATDQVELVLRLNGMG